MAGVMVLLAVVFAGVAFTSCDDDEPYYSPLTGIWGQVDAPGYAYTELTFYNDGYGNYCAYDDFGVWTNWPTTWQINGSRLIINIVETGQQWVYIWSLKGYYLYLDDGYSTLVYKLL